MPYGTIKIDTITFTDGGVDKSVPVSGLVQNPTFTGNVTVTGTISGNIIQGGTTVSGLTVTGTTANFASGVFTTQISGVTITGTTVSTTTGNFTSLTGTTATITSGIIASGTAALPSLAILSDPNTGIYSPGADQLAVATNGTSRLSIDASGNVTVDTNTLYVDAVNNRVAVGTTNPVLPLQVNGAIFGYTSGSATGRFLLRNSTTGSTSGGFDVNQVGVDTTLSNESNGFLSIGTNAAERARIRADGTFEIKGAGTAGTSPGLSVNPSTPANSFVIDSSGRLGIGTSSPGELLDVVGNIRQTGNTAGTGNTVGLIDFYNTNSTATIARINVRTDGATNSGSYRISTANAGTLNEVVRITSAGLVGIGTSSPITQLNNTGTTALGTVNWPTTDVSNASGRVLIGNEGVLVIRKETVGAGSGSEIYLGATSGAGSTTMGFVALKGGTENASNRASFFSVSTQNTIGVGAEAMRITSAGLVGIGTSSPGATCEIYSSSSRRMRVGETPLYTPADFATLGGSLTLSRANDNRTDVHAIYGYDTAAAAFNNLAITSRNQIIFMGNGSERMRIDDSGRLGIGTTSPDYKLKVSGSTGIIKSESANATFGSPSLSLNDTTHSVEIILTPVNGLGAFGTYTNHPLAFYTSASEKARIDTSGRLLVGIIASPAYQLQVSTDSAGKPSSALWTIVSDERIKEDIELADLDLCYEAIKAIPLKRYKWRDDIYTAEQVTDRRKLGWIAQDVEAIFPKAVGTHEFKYNQVFEETIIPAVEEELDADGNVITPAQPERIEQGDLISENVIEDCRDLNSDQLYAAMYGAIQKLMAKVEALEIEVASLKAS